MKKRKGPKQQETPPAPEPEAATDGVVEAASNAEVTAPITAADYPGDSDDTQVGPAPEADDWDGPTREVSAEEVAALAFKSTSEPGGEGEGADAETTLVDGEAASVEATTPEGQGEGLGPGDDVTPLESLQASSGRLESVLESLLFVSDHPLTLTELKRLTGERDGSKVTEALEALKLRRESSGIQVISVAGGWTLRTHQDNVAWVSRLVAGRPQKMSRALMETLAIIAYRQPVTRPEIDEIRGVDCGPVLGTLLERGLVRIIGKKEDVGRPMLYGTTPEFLRTFSLKDLSELPTLREFHELGEAEMARVDAEAPPRAAAGGDAPGTVEGASPTGAAPLPPPRRAPDPEEDDNLMADLERATAAAAKASNIAETPTEAPPPDESVGSAD